MSNRTEAKPGEGTKEEAKTAAPHWAESGGGGGGAKSWLPLVLNIALMPALAFATTKFLLLPQLQKGAPTHSEESAGEGHSKSEGGGKEEASAAHGEKAKEEKAGGHGEKETSKTKIVVPLGGKTIVNVSGTLGTRYLLANISLVGNGSSFRNAVEKNDPELRDAAAGVLSTKTINDLEKPGIRNLVRTELMAVFNTIVGKGMVSDIYLTEFAIQ